MIIMEKKKETSPINLGTRAPVRRCAGWDGPREWRVLLPSWGAGGVPGGLGWGERWGLRHGGRPFGGWEGVSWGFVGGECTCVCFLEKSVRDSAMERLLTRAPPRDA